MGVPGLLGDPDAALGGIMLSAEASLGGMIEAESSLISHFMFGETSGTVALDNRSLHDGTYHGTPTFGVSGPSPLAVTFGSGAYANYAGPINTTAHTIEVWAKVAALPTSTNKGLIAGLYDSSSKHDKCLYLTSDGKINFNISQSGTLKVASSDAAAFPLNRWNHVVGVYDGSAMATLYLNGASVGTVSASSSASGYTTDNLYIGGGPADTYVGQPGTYDEAAVYSSALLAGSILARYNEGIGRIQGVNARVTQAVAEVLRNSSGRKARVTQVVTEVLRATGVGFSYAKAATTSFTVHAKLQSASTLKNVYATSGLTISQSRSVIAAHQYALAAASALGLSDSGEGPKLAVAGAASSFSVSLESHPVFDYTLSGASAFTFSAEASSIRGANSAATTGFTVGDAGSAKRDVFAVGAGVLYLMTYSGEHALYSFRVAAESDIAIGSSSLYIPETTKLVACESGVALVDIAAGSRLLRRRAASRFLVGQFGPTTRVTPILVSASTDFSIGQVLRQTHPGPRLAFASSTIPISASAVETARLLVRASASTGFHLDTSLLASFGIAVSAGTAIRITASKTKTGRVVNVSATTAFGILPGPDSNEFWYLDAENSVHFGMIADVTVGYTPAESRVKFTDLAIARVKLPWRFKPLPLPPGGGLPHS